MLTVSEPSELLETTEEKAYNIRYAADNRNALWAAGAFNFLVVIVMFVTPRQIPSNSVKFQGPFGPQVKFRQIPGIPRSLCQIRQIRQISARARAPTTPLWKMHKAY